MNKSQAKIQILFSTISLFCKEGTIAWKKDILDINSPQIVYIIRKLFLCFNINIDDIQKEVEGSQLSVCWKWLHFYSAMQLTNKMHIFLNLLLLQQIHFGNIEFQHTTFTFASNLYSFLFLYQTLLFTCLKVSQNFVKRGLEFSKNHLYQKPIHQLWLFICA